jgi:hypothetical protein
VVLSFLDSGLIDERVQRSVVPFKVCNLWSHFFVLVPADQV